VFKRFAEMLLCAPAQIINATLVEELVIRDNQLT
jgi:ribulose 1,5-bisphosphate synthetase/thiazole synthase